MNIKKIFLFYHAIKKKAKTEPTTGSIYNLGGR